MDQKTKNRLIVWELDLRMKLFDFGENLATRGRRLRVDYFRFRAKLGWPVPMSNEVYSIMARVGISVTELSKREVKEIPFSIEELDDIFKRTISGYGSGLQHIYDFRATNGIRTQLARHGLLICRPGRDWSTQ